MNSQVVSLLDWMVNLQVSAQICYLSAIDL